MNWWQRDLDDGRLGDYRIEAKLGEGGMAEVFRAVGVAGVHRGRTVAIKVPRIGAIAPDDLAHYLQRFQREIELQNAEPIAHVVTMLGSGEITDQGGVCRPYLVMDYYGGGSLGTALGGRAGRRERRQSLREVTHWLAPIAAALDDLHSSAPSPDGAGESARLHRDIKPDNILFNSRGRPFLSDFGIATRLSGQQQGTSLTGTGLRAPGSWGYGAPESLRGQSVPASDQFSLAVTVYEALSGRFPVQADTPEGYLLAIANWKPTHLHERCPELPRAATDAVMRALSANPSERFLSCSEFAQALARAEHAPAPAAVAAVPDSGVSAPPVAAASVAETAPAPGALAVALRWLAIALSAVALGAGFVEMIRFGFGSLAEFVVVLLAALVFVFALAALAPARPHRAIVIAALLSNAVFLLFGLYLAADRLPMLLEISSGIRAFVGLAVLVIAPALNLAALALRRAAAGSSATVPRWLTRMGPWPWLAAAVVALLIAAVLLWPEPPRRPVEFANTTRQAPVTPTQEQADVAESAPAVDASAPAPDPRDGGFADQGNGLLLDTQTGLLWTQSDNGSDINWNDANSYCQGKNMRLPSETELQGIYDRHGSGTTPCHRWACKVSPLFRLTMTWFWTGDRVGSSEARAMDFSDGNRDSASASASAHGRALCVRRRS